MTTELLTALRGYIDARANVAVSHDPDWKTTAEMREAWAAVEAAVEAAAEAKFAECQARAWELVPGKGYRHVKNPPAPCQCPQCEGDGKDIFCSNGEPCPNCKGTGTYPPPADPPSEQVPPEPKKCQCCDSAFSETLHEYAHGQCQSCYEIPF